MICKSCKLICTCCTFVARISNEVTSGYIVTMIWVFISDIKFYVHFPCLQVLKPTAEAEITNISPMDIKKEMISPFKKIAENSEEIECKILRENLLEIVATAAAYSGNLAAKTGTMGQLKTSRLFNRMKILNISQWNRSKIKIRTGKSVEDIEWKNIIYGNATYLQTAGWEDMAKWHLCISWVATYSQLQNNSVINK